MAQDNHLAEEILAALVEGNLEGADKERAQEHLARCRSCMAAFGEAVRFQSRWLDEPEAFVPTPEMIAAARGATVRATPVRAERKPPRHRQVAWGLRPVIVTLGAAAAALVALLLWLSPGLMQGGASSNPSVVALVQRAAERASAHGMVLPFGEGFSLDDMTVYRAGAPESSPELTDAIGSMIERYEQGDASGQAACLLVAGQLAAGHLGNARVFVAEARQRYADVSCLATLEAIIAYRENQVDRAESLLRQVLRDESGNLLASFNLGLLLAERGRYEEARPLLERVRDARPQSPLASRAEALLEGGVPR